MQKTKQNQKETPEELDIQPILQRYHAARQRRESWEPLWKDCYDFTLPQRGDFDGMTMPGARRMDKIYDATALDAVDQLAASLLSNLTPTWSQWFGLKPGPELSAEEAESLAPVLEKAGKVIQDHFDRSNFAVEIHQCYLDLIVGGTASLFFEESEPGEFSAFKFTASPLIDIILEEGASGRLDTTYRQLALTLAQIQSRYEGADIPSDIIKQGERDTQARFKVLEAITPNGLIHDYTAILMDGNNGEQLLKTGTFEQAPVINFRWLKSPGETYGRSPVMKALPDIKTANKVVELILKNASITVTGIWQADDDGILNPATVELTPGSIIPKAIGSKGLQPLEMPGRFDVSQLMLDNLQAQIRHALLVDRLAPLNSPRMTATEVLERAAEMSMILGATYGRLQSELLTPLIKRAFSILRRRGEVPDISIDGRLVMVDYRSPLARSQGQRNVQNTMSWINSLTAMGAEAADSVDYARAARFLGDALAVPSDLIKKELPPVVEPKNSVNPNSGLSSNVIPSEVEGSDLSITKQDPSAPSRSVGMTGKEGNSARNNE